MKFRISLCLLQIASAWALLLDHADSYEIRPTPTGRRAFLREVAVGATFATVGVITRPNPSLAADIKVSPLAHTFVTAKGAAKPLRENDATRYCTNAKVVFLLEGPTAKKGDLALEVFDLTVKRKLGEGPGVTPGKVQVLSNSQSIIDAAKSANLLSSKSTESVEAIVSVAKSLPEGDVLVVGPLPSMGVAEDGKLLAATAEQLGTFVGGRTGRGVISVLLDGPRENIQFEASGYPISDLLWYSF